MLYQKKIYKKVSGEIAYKLLEFFLVSGTISAIITGLLALPILNDSAIAYAIVTTLCVLVYIYLIGSIASSNYTNIKIKKRYFVSSYIAYIIYIALNICMFCFDTNVLYNIFFIITRFAQYCIPEIPLFTSIIIFHTIMLISITVMPFIIRAYKMSSVK